MAEAEPIEVTQDEYDEEKKAIAAMEEELRGLEARWDSFVEANPGKLLVSRSEYRSETGRISSLGIQLREMWAEWGRYMRLVRVTRRQAAESRRRSFLPAVTISARELRRAEAERASAQERVVERYLSFLRGIRRELRRIGDELRGETKRRGSKIIIPPELGLVLDRVAELQPRLEAERERFARKVVTGLYRTQYAEMYYVEDPRSKTPTPIAEFRVTGVSRERGHYRIEEFRRVLRHMGIIHSMTAPWKMMFNEWLEVVETKVTASEQDETIDEDELASSVPVYRSIDYAERYSCWYRSRRGMEWEEDYAPEPVREGTPHDYEYGEKWYKDRERELMARGRLRQRFDNVRGVLTGEPEE